MLQLRVAARQDIPLVLSLIRELAEYEREPNAVHCTEEDLQRDGFGPKPVFRAIIAEWNNAPAGMALYYYFYSTWAGRRGLFLEDLYVRPEFRAKGVGKALMAKLGEIAIDEKCYGLRWEVLDWNKPAIGFYQRLGSESREDWKVMQITGERLRQLAETKPDRL